MWCAACGNSVQIGIRRCPVCKTMQYPSSTSPQAGLEDIDKLEMLPTQQLTIPDSQLMTRSVAQQSAVPVLDTVQLPDSSSDLNAIDTIPTQYLSAAITPVLEANTSIDLDVMPTQRIAAMSASAANKQDKFPAPVKPSVPETPKIQLPTALMNEHLAMLPTSQLAAIKEQAPMRVTQGSNTRSLITMGVAIVVIVLTSIVLRALLSALPTGKQSHVRTTTSIVTPQISRITGPSGKQVLPTATHIITNLHIAAQIDNNYDVVQVQNTFTINQTIYITFTLASTGRQGYIYSIWYSNNKAIHKDIFAHNPMNSVGYFSGSYPLPTSATIELYWCTQYNCNDAQLAQVVHLAIIPNATSGGA